jgi:hypothetical protein
LSAFPDDQEREVGLRFTHVRFQPKPILQDPAEYSGQSAITVSCTQMAEAKEQRRLISAWEKALPQMRELRRLDFVCHFSRGLLSAVAAVPNLEELYIKWSNLKSVEPLLQAKSLKSFHLGSSPSVQDPELLVQLPLIQLSLENVRAVYDLKWLQEMPLLEHLYLEGGMWWTQKIDCLEPLQALKSLEWLSLVGARVRDRASLRTVEAMPSLKVFETSWYWPKGALRQLAQRRPDLWVNERRWPNWQDLHEREMIIRVHESWESFSAAAKEQLEEH